ncbi:MAG: DNA primase [Endomicrobiaceae bacterium]|jgi:DNA primase|nr:DNA primase [Endomicrobiaceae bacterium]MDD4166015.1 DNA primase [Endomicrobiaceae bacterium]
MAISDHIIDQIRTSSSIEYVIQEYVPDLKKSGKNWKCCCPFHSEKTPSFVVSPEKGIFRCFGCGVAGDVFKFVMLIENIPWIEAVRKLAQKSGITIEERKEDKIALSEKAKIFELLESAARFYHRCFIESKSAQIARDYSKERGLSQETIQKFMIGYAPKGKLLESALKKGYSYEELVKAGLVTKTESGMFFEYMSDRLVFPILDIQGRVVAFGGRTLTNQKTKYLNTPETVVYSKSANLYGLFRTLPDLKKDKRIILLEGYMDVVMTQQYGISGAVASLGTSFTAQQAKLIARYAEEIIVLFDSDDAGRTATQRALEIFAENDITSRTVSLPEGIDPDEYLLEHGKNSFDDLINKKSKSAIDFMTDRITGFNDLKKSGGKAKAASALLDFVVKNKNTITQREYIREISQRLNLEEEILWQEFKKRKIFKTENITKQDLLIKDKKDKEENILEEEMIKFLLSQDCRNFAGKLDGEFWTSEKCRKIYGFFKEKKDVAAAEILSKLEDDDAGWFSGLVMEATAKTGDLQEIFDSLYRDIQAEKLKNARKRLEKEILLMTDGKIPVDAEKIKEYNLLTSKIKGSGKNK